MVEKKRITEMDKTSALFQYFVKPPFALIMPLSLLWYSSTFIEF